jgi:catechol 2,3-dioxygenase-like lactoylglutathione lyase family enzyme
MITGLNHITFSVSDINRSFDFYSTTLGCKPIAKWKRGAYLLVGDMWLCLSLDQNTRTAPLAEYTHIAFSVLAENFEDFNNRLVSFGSKYWKENSSEGASLYILDPDGHKLELHVGDLWSRIAATRKAPYEGMEFFEP